MNTNKLISELNAEQMEKELPEFGPGDTVVVQVKVKEGSRERLQAFEGVVIAKRNRGLNSAFTVRKISHGIGVERVVRAIDDQIRCMQMHQRDDEHSGQKHEYEKGDAQPGSLHGASFSGSATESSPPASESK